MTTTHPTAKPAIVSVGLDGRSQPMYRYAEDLSLPDHMRRIVAKEDRPDYMTVENPVIHPTPEAYDGLWALIDSPFGNEWGDGVLVTIDGWDGTDGYEDETGEWVTTEVDYHTTFVTGPRRLVHNGETSQYVSHGYGSVPAKMLRRPTEWEIRQAETEALDRLDDADRALEEANERVRAAKILVAAIETGHSILENSGQLLEW